MPVTIAVDQDENVFAFRRPASTAEPVLTWDEAELSATGGAARWSAATGEALGAGEPLPSRSTYWFSFASAFPQVTVYERIS